MNINLEENQILNVLTAIRSEFINSKVYYSNNSKEENLIGITSPKEWKEIYNAILEQAHEEERLTMLEVIK